ncbi:acyltransferase family protein [Edaphobacillus lindanitolerans]|uniref:Fucose 4-O-acetylase n=1 Tax=Edaphobacillus lindanitolerans TaxID=550447 RepID=A0A1U7PHX7_9BACI|nr:acyltransferase family protein [Edaphobacillus lindanitolerans]SIT70353.1 Fucose 4-O-acetylase [Edaphobacillus lindanitolerans]
MAKKRLTWVDVTKGFLMILVVIGHYPGELDFPLSKYIYWFHMPAFFLISGLFFKEAKSRTEAGESILKRFMQLIVPYLFFLLVITVIRYGMELGYGNTDIHWYLNDLWSLVIGGRFVRGAYGVFWFVTTLFAVFVIFTAITRHLSRKVQIAVMAGFYLAAHAESLFAKYALSGGTVEAAQQIPLPWNLDVALMAAVYFGIGYYLKEFWMEISKKWFVAGIVTVAACLLLDATGVFDYRLSMKFLRYDHLFLDLIIPISCTIVLIGLFQRLTARIPLTWLQKIENHSISVMYLHIFADIVLNDFFTYGLIGFTAIGLVLPILVSIGLQKFVPYGKLLLGGFRPKKKRQAAVAGD